MFVKWMFSLNEYFWQMSSFFKGFFPLKEISCKMKVLEKRVFSLNARSLNIIRDWKYSVQYNIHENTQLNAYTFLYISLLCYVTVVTQYRFFCTFKQQPRVISHDGYLFILIIFQYKSNVFVFVVVKQLYFNFLY